MAQSVVLLVPGIMATRMELAGEEIWPPTPWETQTGYDRIEELQSPDAHPTEVIYSILCFGFYRSLRCWMRRVGYVPDGADRLYADFPYDWRLDLFDTADRLAERLDELAADGATEIHLLGHSMGGLVCRLVLESGRYEDRPGFTALRSFVSLAVPHLGAPLALARIFGIDTTLGISGEDFATLAGNRAYPSGYQLMPAPGEGTIWDARATGIPVLDPYDPDVAARLGLDSQLVARAAAVHEILGQNRAPEGVRYFFMGGVGHRTVTRINVFSDGRAVDHRQSIVTRTKDAGDGTVPSFSALPRSGQRQLVVGEHATVFESEAAGRALARLLGSDLGVPEEIAAELEAAGVATLRLSADRIVYPLGTPIEITLSSGDAEEGPEPGAAPIHALDARLVIDRIDENGTVSEAGHREIALRYDGPALERLAVELPPEPEPGLFSARLTGTPAGRNELAFAVGRAGPAQD